MDPSRVPVTVEPYTARQTWSQRSCTTPRG